MNNREKVMLKVAGYKHDIAGGIVNPLLMGLAGAGVGGLIGAGVGGTYEPMSFMSKKLQDKIGYDPSIHHRGATGALGGAGLGAMLGGGVGMGAGLAGKLVGILSGSLKGRANTEDLKKYNNESALGSYLIPGRGAYKTIQRRRAISGLANPEGYTTPVELLGTAGGSVVANAIAPGSGPLATLIGAIMGMKSKNRTMAEQAEYEKNSNGAQNLIPGRGAYNLIKALQLSNDVK
jgi:hypothetical protein